MDISGFEEVRELWHGTSRGEKAISQGPSLPERGQIIESREVVVTVIRHGNYKSTVLQLYKILHKNFANSKAFLNW